MNTVIEGLDNAGKSTLAQYIAKLTGRQVFASEGPEKWDGELNQRVERYSDFHNTYGPVIFDRHPCVSDIIYSTARGRPSVLTPDNIDAFYKTQPFFIYCDTGQRGLGSHILKEHDTPEHMEIVSSHYASLLHHYRVWAAERAHIIYRVGDDRDRIVAACNDFDPVRDVAKFMERFGQSYEGMPRALPADLSLFREDFMREELGEYVEHARHLQAALKEGDFEDKEIADQLEQQLDGLIDLLYVAIGTGYLHGFDLREAWRRVHEANMKKEKVARRGDSTRHSLFDIIKPAGWKRPDHSDLVADHIHRRA